MGDPQVQGGKQVQIDRLAIRDIDATLKLSVFGGFGLDTTLELQDIEADGSECKISAGGSWWGGVVIALITALQEKLEDTQQPGLALPNGE